MRKEHIYARFILAVSLCGIPVAAARAQTANQPPASDSSSNQSTPPDAPTPSPTPKAKSKSATPPAASTNQAPTPDAPQAPAKKPSTADDNPFPEDVSSKAAAAAKAADAATPNAPTSNSPTPAEKQQGSSSLDGLDKLGLDDPARKQLKLESPDGTSAVYDPKRATDDVKVGKFYLQTGYFKGAYERFKDATVFDHENVEAVFYLAEAAQKLNLAKEAQQNYQLYLAAVPDGPSAKAAKKALGELASTSKP
jgi:hypothetical protein